MSFKIDQRECKVCDRKVLGLRRRPNHVLHLLLTAGTAGLWFLGWMVIALNSEDEPWRCSYCGSPTDKVEQGVGGAGEPENRPAVWVARGQNGLSTNRP